jgi:1,2-beta-oligoglucan phosphorylase
MAETLPHWKWDVEMTNGSQKNLEAELIAVQDVGLRTPTNELINEYYVSQYIDRQILQHTQFGTVICCRQNMAQQGSHPWLMMACTDGAVSGTTDGMGFYGRTYCITGEPEGLQYGTLPGGYAGESSIIALQSKGFILHPGQNHTCAFVFVYLPNHPVATSARDLHVLYSLSWPTSYELSERNELPQLRNIFHTAPLLQVETLPETELVALFGSERRHAEFKNGQQLAFFSGGSNHVVLNAKEALTDRPHGHIMQANISLTPHEGTMSTNPYMFGVFNSHITQGNTNFNILMSVCTGPFNLDRSSGQRIFVQFDGQIFQLGVPSAFEMGLNHCRWIYRFGNRCLQVRTWTELGAPHIHTDVTVLDGDPVDLVITHRFDPRSGWVQSADTDRSVRLIPSADSPIARHFPDASFLLSYSDGEADYSLPVDNQLFALHVRSTRHWSITITGNVLNPTEQQPAGEPRFGRQTEEFHRFWHQLSLGLTIDSESPDIQSIREMLPWFGVNALTHYLTPYGLEQFSGAAWGTRDVAQGPIEMLLHLGRYDEVRRVLCIIFSNQQPDGAWPQWWMFDRYNHVRAHEAHGDIMYWCIIALALYLRVTRDFSIMEEVLPYFTAPATENANSTADPNSTETSSSTEDPNATENGNGTADPNSTENTDITSNAPEPLWSHMDRLIKRITDSFMPNTALVPFGGGDWNDSLQPVSQDLADRMISSWTVQMNYQAFREYAWVFEQTGRDQQSAQMHTLCERIRSDFNRWLVPEGVVAGYGLRNDDGTIGVLLHPTDTTTGIAYGVLPMNRGVLSGMFTPAQANLHRNLTETHLKGPDGVRLMNKPLPFRGGLQNIFQRAESSSYFGREIGLMYTHEHIRYAEMLAITGDAPAFLKALRQIIPIGYLDVVTCADQRQSNCYYSSSDAVFVDRYEADRRYQDILDGTHLLKGGWRVYSSGPGICIGLVIGRLLGIRMQAHQVILDPVLSPEINDLKVQINLMGYPIVIRYSTGTRGFSPVSIRLNGHTIAFDRDDNLYRDGGAVINLTNLRTRLQPENNLLQIDLS